MNMEPAGFSETVVTVCQTTKCHSREEYKLKYQNSSTHAEASFSETLLFVFRNSRSRTRKININRHVRISRQHICFLRWYYFGSFTSGLLLY